MVRTFGFGGDISFSLLKRKFDDCRFFCSETKKENSLPHELQKGLTIEYLTPKLLDSTYVAFSTTKAEYIVVGNCCAQILWMKQQLEDYNIYQNHIPLKCDNTSAINLTKNPIMDYRTKHIEIRHHFLRDHISKGNCVIEYVNTKHQLVEIFTKPLAEDGFYELRRDLEILEIS